MRRRSVARSRQGELLDVDALRRSDAVVEDPAVRRGREFDGVKGGEDHPVDDLSPVVMTEGSIAVRRPPRPSSPSGRRRTAFPRNGRLLERARSQQGRDRGLGRVGDDPDDGAGNTDGAAARNEGASSLVALVEDLVPLMARSVTYAWPPAMVRTFPAPLAPVITRPVDGRSSAGRGRGERWRVGAAREGKGTRCG